MKVLLWENAVNEPFDEERVEKKHEAAEYDQRNAEDVRTQKRAQLAKKPVELLVEPRTQDSSRGPFDLPKLEIALTRCFHLNMTPSPEQQGTSVTGCKSMQAKFPRGLSWRRALEVIRERQTANSLRRDSFRNSMGFT